MKWIFRNFVLLFCLIFIYGCSFVASRIIPVKDIKTPTGEYTIGTKTYNWIHQRILEFVKADPDEYTCFFSGSGTTSGMNRIARTLNQYRSSKDIVFVICRLVVEML